MANGIAITQEGIDVENASDYQKVLDSRWLFFEVAMDIEETISVPSLGVPATRGFQRINIVRHGCTRDGRPFVPAFHSGWKRDEAFVDNDDSYTYTHMSGVAADDEYIYFYREYISGFNAPAFTVHVKAKIYNIPILDDYLAPIEIAPDTFKQDTRIGVRALDGTDSTAKITGHSSTGFSIDTRKKILSIHKVAQKLVNYQFYDTALVTAIDTATNIITLANDPEAQSYPDGHFSELTWIATGLPVDYFPDDYVTYPSPLVFASPTPPYIIKIDDTHIKLAATQADAFAGNAIDITTTGSLPAFIRNNGSADNERIAHDNNYPPSYMFCGVIDNNINGVGQAVKPLYHVSWIPLVMADNEYLYFRGVQAAYMDHIAVIIIKDPIEVAR